MTTKFVCPLCVTVLPVSSATTVKCLNCEEKVVPVEAGAAAAVPASIFGDRSVTASMIGDDECVVCDKVAIIKIDGIGSLCASCHTNMTVCTGCGGLLDPHSIVDQATDKCAKCRGDQPQPPEGPRPGRMDKVVQIMQQDKPIGLYLLPSEPIVIAQAAGSNNTEEESVMSNETVFTCATCAKAHTEVDIHPLTGICAGCEAAEQAPANISSICPKCSTAFDSADLNACPTCAERYWEAYGPVTNNEEESTMQNVFTAKPVTELEALIVAGLEAAKSRSKFGKDFGMKLVDVTETLINAQGRIVELENHVGDLEAAMASDPSWSIEKVAPKLQEIRDLKETIAQLTGRAEVAEAQVSAMSTKVQQLEARLAKGLTMYAEVAARLTKGLQMYAALKAQGQGARPQQARPAQPAQPRNSRPARTNTVNMVEKFGAIDPTSKVSTNAQGQQFCHNHTHHASIMPMGKGGICPVCIKKQVQPAPASNNQRVQISHEMCVTAVNNLATGSHQWSQYSEAGQDAIYNLLAHTDIRSTVEEKVWQMILLLTKPSTAANF